MLILNFSLDLWPVCVMTGSMSGSANACDRFPFVGLYSMVMTYPSLIFYNIQVNFIIRSKIENINTHGVSGEGPFVSQKVDKDICSILINKIYLDVSKFSIASYLVTTGLLLT